MDVSTVSDYALKIGHIFSFAIID